MKRADVTALAVVDGREPEQAVGVITTADVARVIADGESTPASAASAPRRDLRHEPGTMESPLPARGRAH